MELCRAREAPVCPKHHTNTATCQKCSAGCRTLEGKLWRCDIMWQVCVQYFGSAVYYTRVWMGKKARINSKNHYRSSLSPSRSPPPPFPLPRSLSSPDPPLIKLSTAHLHWAGELSNTHTHTHTHTHSHTHIVEHKLKQMEARNWFSVLTTASLFSSCFNSLSASL